MVMKTKISLFTFGVILFLPGTPLLAQISDSEPSVNVLAVQCAVSSGYSPADFDDYSRRLAKTLALLSPTQQTRVFGYLPQPNGAMKGSLRPSAPASSPTSSVGSSAAAPAAEATAPGALDGLINLVGNINEAITGAGSDSATATPVFAGTAPEAAVSVPVTGNEIIAAASGAVASAPINGDLSLQASAEPATTTAATGAVGTTSPAKSGSWDALVAWFAAAQSAYDAGTLNEFLQTPPAP
jgi:hypothetical protein